MKFNIKIKEQPDDTTCGPTCLHSVYNYFEDHISLDEVIQNVKMLKDGGTLAVMLGIDALKRGYESELYSYNLKIFDLSWNGLSNEELIEKLELQLQHKKGLKFTEASKAYIEYLKCGGKILFDNLTAKLLKKYLAEKTPLLVGLSATYLYQTKREHYANREKSTYDDIKGEPQGHFVVLSGIRNKNIYVADPYRENPITKDNYYKVEIDRLLSAMLLGIITYDANMLIIKPSK